jgi:hypothetical protein
MLFATDRRGRPTRIFPSRTNAAKRRAIACHTAGNYGDALPISTFRKMSRGTSSRGESERRTIGNVSPQSCWSSPEPFARVELEGVALEEI